MSVWTPTECYKFSNEIKASSKINVKKKKKALLYYESEY